MHIMASSAGQPIAVDFGVIRVCIEVGDVNEPLVTGVEDGDGGFWSMDRTSEWHHHPPHSLLIPFLLHDQLFSMVVPTLIDFVSLMAHSHSHTNCFVTLLAGSKII